MKFDEKKLSTFINNTYANLGIISSISLLNSHENGETYQILTNNGDFVLHRNKSDNKKRIEKMCQILSEVHECNCKVIFPIKTKYDDFSKNNYYLTKFEKGDFFVGTKKEFINLAKNLSLLHKNFNNQYYPFKPNQRNYNLFQENELSIIKRKISKIKTPSKFEKLIKQNLHIIEIEIKKNILYLDKTVIQKQIIHFDLHPRNVIFENGDVKCFLDFNSMRMGNPIQDVVFSGFRFACQISQNHKIISDLMITFLDKYNDKKISYENSYLQFILIRSILIRICFILRKYFFQSSDSWISDLENQLFYLKLAKKILK